MEGYVLKVTEHQGACRGPKWGTFCCAWKWTSCTFKSFLGIVAIGWFPHGTSPMTRRAFPLLSPYLPWCPKRQVLVFFPQDAVPLLHRVHILCVFLTDLALSLQTRLAQICLPLPLSAGIKGTYHHAWLEAHMFCSCGLSCRKDPFPAGWGPTLLSFCRKISPLLDEHKQLQYSSLKASSS